MRAIRIGDKVFNKATDRWETVVKVGKIKSGITGYKRFMNLRGISEAVETDGGFAICVTPELRVKREVNV